MNFKWKRNINHAFLKEIMKIRPATQVKSHSHKIKAGPSPTVTIIRKRPKKHPSQSPSN